MSYSKNARSHLVASNPIESQIGPFIAVLKAAGYAPGTLCTKRAAIRRFLRWRRRRKPPGSEPDEAAVAEFLVRVCRLGPKHRCLASTALSAFLEHLRRQGVIATRAPDAPETISSALERR
jgi:hypothetical protein